MKAYSPVSFDYKELKIAFDKDGEQVVLFGKRQPRCRKIGQKIH